MAKRGSSHLHLVLGLNKSQGYSSHDAVGVVKRLFAEKRCGHTGTLDPLATGVLAVCVGSATRLNQVLEHDSKTYQFRILFGIETNTYDADGQIVECPVAPGNILEDNLIEQTLRTFLGSQMQIPPSYSALKLGGRRAYERARKGEDVQLEARPINVYSIKVLGKGLHTNLKAPFSKLPQLSWKHQLQESYSQPYWDLEVEVSKGCYIRSLARDMARSLGTGAHVALLHRIRVGSLSIEDCLMLEDLEGYAYQGEERFNVPELPNSYWEEHEEALEIKSLDVLSLLEGTRVNLTVSERESVIHGNPIPLATSVHRHDIQRSFDEGESVCLTYNGELMALAQYKNDQQVFKPRVVFPSGIVGKRSFSCRKKPKEDFAKARNLCNKRAGKAQIIYLDAHTLSSPLMTESALAWGVFDGLHKGHKDLIESTRKYAQKHDLSSGVISFDRDPDECFKPHAEEKLMANTDRLEALARSGVDFVFVIPFVKELYTLEAKDFLERLFAHAHPRSIHVGENFHFGYKAQGGIDLLSSWTSDKGVSLFVQNLLRYKEQPISASRIRVSIQKGEMADVQEMLGSRFSLQGEVVHGRAQGRVLGFPTANILCDTKLIKPAYGVYSGLARGTFGIKPCAISVGIPPHFSTEAIHDIEAHILDFDGDLYATKLDIEFCDFLREQKRFESLNDLKRAIAQDVEEVRSRFKNIVKTL